MARVNSSRLAVLVLAALVAGVGCNDKSSDSGGDEPGIPKAAATGTVFRPQSSGLSKSALSGLIIVDSASHAPVGYVAVAGAKITALDIDREELESVTTGGDGRFELDRLDHGFVSLEIRTTPSSLTPDTIVSLTAIAGHSVSLGASFPVDRDSASLYALDGVSCATLVIGTLQPLPAGTVVRDYIAAAGVALRTTLNAEWLFIVDGAAGGLYPHPLEYVFVDAQNGSVTRINATGPPAIEGGALWSSDLDYTHYEDVDWSAIVDADTLVATGFVRSAEVIKSPDCELSATGRDGWLIPPELLKELKETSAADIFTLNVCGLRRSDGYSDVVRFNYFASRFAPASNRETVVFPFAFDAKAGQQAYDATWSRLNSKINNRLNQGGKPTLIVFFHGHSAHVSPGPQFGGMTAEYLNGTSDIWTTHRFLIPELRSCKTRVIADLCFSEDFVLAMSDRFAARPVNLRADYVGYSSSASNETSHGWLLETELEDGSVQGGSIFLTAALPHMTVDANNELVGMRTTEGTIISQLESVVANYGGVVQHPKVVALGGAPVWCEGLGPVVSITSPPILHTSIGIALSCDEELPQIVFLNGDTSTINWSISDPKGAFRYPAAGGSLDAGETTKVGINYLCTEESSFTAPVTISGSRVNGTRSGSATTFVTVTVDPGSKSSDFVIDVLGPLAGRDINIWHPLPTEAEIDSTKLEVTQTGQPPPPVPWPTCPQTTFSVVYEGLKPDDTLYYGVQLRLENNTLDICGPEETIPCRYTIWYSRRP